MDFLKRTKTVHTPWQPTRPTTIRKKPNNSQPQSLAYSNANLKTPDPPRITDSLPHFCGKCNNKRLLLNTDRHPECPTCGWINYDWIVNPLKSNLMDSFRPSITLLPYSGTTPQWANLALRLELSETRQRVGVKGKELLLADCPICRNDTLNLEPSNLTKGLSSKGRYTVMTCERWGHSIKLIRGKDGGFRSWES